MDSTKMRYQEITQLLAMKLVQRINEFKPGFTLAQLQTLMQSQPLNPELGKYFHFSQYILRRTPRNQPSKWQVTRAQLPPWLSPGLGMGNEKPLVTEPMVKDKADYCWDIITEGKVASGKHWTKCPAKSSGNREPVPEWGWAT